MALKRGLPAANPGRLSAARTRGLPGRLRLCCRISGRAQSLQRMKLLFDESLSPRLVELLRDLFPESESALRNGLAGGGDLRILEYASAANFILVSTDGDFEGLLSRIPGANVVILGSCNYPTEVAAEVLRRNAIRIAELPNSPDHLIILDQVASIREVVGAPGHNPLGCATPKPDLWLPSRLAE